MQFYGYFEFIKYEKKDYLIINGRQINFESYKIKREVLVRIGSQLAADTIIIYFKPLEKPIY